MDIESECTGVKDVGTGCDDILEHLFSRKMNLTSPSDYISTLPKCVKRRVKALKKLQLAHTNLESEFYKEAHALECKYAMLYEPLYKKRYEIVSSKIEPTEEECNFPSDDEENESFHAIKNAVEMGDSKDASNEMDKEVEGIPGFWYMILKNVDMLNEMIQEHDEPILKHLQDIRCKFSKENPMGFTLEFCFEPNEYFENTILTKEYEIKCTPYENDPFSFEGPEIFKCKGCTIHWNPGKNVTVKTLQKKQKHRSRATVRTITKTVQNDSFFNFFNPPTVPDDDEQMNKDTQTQLVADFELGHFIRERIIPRAALFFTGEALGDDFDDEEEENIEINEADEQDEEVELDESDVDENPPDE